MARRGTRVTRKDFVSGSTFQTQPSGTTIDSLGVTSPLFTDGTSSLMGADLANLATIAGPAVGMTATSALRISADIVNWTGASIFVTTGLTTIVMFSGSHMVDGSAGVDLSAASPAVFVAQPSNGVAGGLTIALYNSDAQPASVQASGGSISWMALGT